MHEDKSDRTGGTPDPADVTDAAKQTASAADATVPAVAVEPDDADQLTRVAVICSNCGTTYVADPAAGGDSMVCPRCGPSVVVGHPRGGRHSWRIPRFRWTLGTAQLIVIALVFGLFLAVGMLVMNSQTGSKRPLSKDAVVQFLRGQFESFGSPATKSKKLDASQSNRRVIGSVAKANASTNPTSAATGESSTSGLDSDASEDLDATPQGSSGVGTLDDPLDAALPRALNASLKLIATRPPVPKNNITVQYVMTNVNQLVGHQARMLCQIVAMHEDARGRVPLKFSIDGRDVQLAREDERNYQRITIRDIDGRVFENVFARLDGSVGRKLKWTQVADWLILTCTPGTRYDRYVGKIHWGLIVTGVDSPASDAGSLDSGPQLREPANTTDSNSTPPASSLPKRVGLHDGLREG